MKTVTESVAEHEWAFITSESIQNGSPNTRLVTERCMNCRVERTYHRAENGLASNFAYRISINETSIHAPDCR